jgi:hypothetical protein
MSSSQPPSAIAMHRSAHHGVVIWNGTDAAPGGRYLSVERGPAVVPPPSPRRRLAGLRVPLLTLLERAPLTLPEIVEAMQISTADANAVLYALQQRGDVAKVGRRTVPGRSFGRSWLSVYGRTGEASR